MMKIINYKKDQIILDLCGAPGGKSASLVEQYPCNKIICSDISFHRLSKIKDTIVRLGHEEIKPIVFDGMLPAIKKKSIDIVVVDAPCSNLGSGTTAS